MYANEKELTEDQRLMREACRAFVNDYLRPYIQTNWQREWLMEPEKRITRELLEAADKVGLRTLAVPEEFGGTPLDPENEIRTFTLIAEEIARGDTGFADKVVQCWKISVLLRNLAPRHLQERWFARFVKDPTFLMAHCLTEPRGASDRWLGYNAPEAAMHTRAVLEGDEWVLNGRKQFVSNGYDAKLFVVYANTKPGVGMRQGTSSFLIPRETKGLTVPRCNETLGCRFMNNGEIVLENCRLPKDHCLAENAALSKASVYFRPGKVLAASKYLGVGMEAFERTANYVQNHVQGGRILIKHQAVAVRLAHMATRLTAVRGVIAQATRALSSRAPEADVLCDMAKMFAAQNVFWVCRNAMELHGGNGIMLEFGIEKLVRDSASAQHTDGGVDVTCFRIVKGMFPETAGIYAGPEQ